MLGHFDITQDRALAGKTKVTLELYKPKLLLGTLGRDSIVRFDLHRASTTKSHAFTIRVFGQAVVKINVVLDSQITQVCVLWAFYGRPRIRKRYRACQINRMG